MRAITLLSGDGDNDQPWFGKARGVDSMKPMTSNDEEGGSLVTTTHISPQQQVHPWLSTTHWLATAHHILTTHHTYWLCLAPINHTHHPTTMHSAHWWYIAPNTKDTLLLWGGFNNDEEGSTTTSRVRQPQVQDNHDNREGSTKMTQVLWDQWGLDDGRVSTKYAGAENLTTRREVGHRHSEYHNGWWRPHPLCKTWQEMGNPTPMYNKV